MTRANPIKPNIAAFLPFLLKFPLINDVIQNAVPIINVTLNNENPTAPTIAELIKVNIGAPKIDSQTIKAPLLANLSFSTVVTVLIVSRETAKYFEK